jgi:hypothetical protein
VVKTLNGDKTSGLDGFSLAFFQSCWEVLKEDVMNVFHEFHARGKFERSFNTSFIALIPKKVEAVNIKNFHPISLVTGVYKIISKVLANELKAVLEKFTSRSHNAFIRGRQILASIIVANECLDSIIRFGFQMCSANLT